MVFRGTAFVSVALTGVRFDGQVTAAGRSHPIRGVGTLDHPMGRVRRSAVSAGMGWWEYNCFRLAGSHTLFQWFAVDRSGDELLNLVATDAPDGTLRLGTLELTYSAWDQEGDTAIPVSWSVAARFPDAAARYSVAAAGPDRDGAAHERGAPYPNLLLRLDGEIRTTHGGDHRLEGVGTGETVVSERDPFHDAPQAPW
jgi:hypothetical protein